MTFQAFSERGQEAQIQRAVNLKDMIIQLEGILKLLKRIRMDSLLHLQTYRRPAATATKLLLDLLQQIFSFLFINEQISIPCNPEPMNCLWRVTPE
ncbi:hypothetical protein D1872_232710 [compost metagenome]